MPTNYLLPKFGMYHPNLANQAKKAKQLLPIDFLNEKWLY